MASALGFTSILEYLGGEFGNRCGYCKSDAGNLSHGMWAHALSVQDYQDLIDRGWRRSGKYVYKPLMKETCCPQYTIRLSALSFQCSKSQKKVLKKMQKYLHTGEVSRSKHDEAMDSQADSPVSFKVSITDKPEVSADELKPVAIELEDTERKQGDTDVQSNLDSDIHENQTPKIKPSTSTLMPGKGADTSKPPCRKAKEIRKERHLQKLWLQKADRTEPTEEADLTPTLRTPKANSSKPLEEFLHVTDPEKAAHRLEVRIVRSSPPSPQFKATFQESYQVYKRYQTTIHKDPPDKPTISQVRKPKEDIPNLA